jgi:hypothetical protein
MTSEPLPAECARMQRRLSEDDPGQDVLDHLAGCQDCAAFAAALVEIEARLAHMPQPEPPAGAVDRAIVRFRAELVAHASPGAASLSEPLAPATPAAPVPSFSGDPSPVTTPHAGRARARRWHRPAILAAGLTAAIALVVSLLAVLGPAGTPLGYAGILREAAARTGAEKSARFGLTGAIGLSVRGQTVTAAVSGSGSSEFPDRGQLTEVATLHGKPLLQQDTVSVGDRVWTRTNDGPWKLGAPDDASPLAQSLANPAQAVDDLSRVGSGYRSLGTATVDGTRVRQIQVTIPGDSFHAFGNLPQQASHWTVVADLSQASLVLRRLTITGSGVVSELGTRAPFTFSLQLTLRDFGAAVTIQPPAGSPSTPCRHCGPGSPATSPTTKPVSQSGSAPGSPGPSPGTTPSPSTRPSPGPTRSGSPSPRPTSTAPSPRPTPTRSVQPSPTPTASCPPSPGPAAKSTPAVAHRDCSAPPAAGTRTRRQRPPAVLPAHAGGTGRQRAAGQRGTGHRAAASVSGLTGFGLLAVRAAGRRRRRARLRAGG